MRNVCGIDIGLKGFIAFINDDHLLELHPIPVIGNTIDVIEFSSILRAAHPELIYLEKAECRPGQNIKATLTCGTNFGMILGALAVLRLPHIVLECRKWQASMLLGTEQSLGSKARSLLAAARIFPDTDFGKNDNKSDAALIAYYGLTHL